MVSDKSSLFRITNLPSAYLNILGVVQGGSFSGGSRRSGALAPYIHGMAGEIRAYRDKMAGLSFCTIADCPKGEVHGRAE